MSQRFPRSLIAITGHAGPSLIRALFSEYRRSTIHTVVVTPIGEASMHPNKALWEKGDFTRIADSMRESGEALVKRIGITRGQRIMDLGCGDGTTAIPAGLFWPG